VHVFTRPVRRTGDTVVRDLVSRSAEVALFLVGVQVAGRVLVPRTIGVAPEPVFGR
jgi:hypothetical protein